MNRFNIPLDPDRLARRARGRSGLPRPVVLLGAAGVAAALGLLALVNSLRPARPLASAAESAAARPDSSSVGAAPGVFQQMRPRSGDHMTPPRIGFRWTFVPDSTAPALETGVRYRLHVVGPGGRPRLLRVVEEPRATVDIDERFPFGECAWWVEAEHPGQPLLRSPTERFNLAP